MRERGLTLIEAMIAIAIFAIIGLLTYGTFSRAVEAHQRAEAITTRYHQLRQALRRMANEISMAYITAHKDCEEDRTETIFLGKRSSNGMRLDFSAFAHFKTRADANESDQTEISYYVDRDPRDSKRTALIRRSQAPIDDDPEDGGIEQVLAEDVSNLELEFYDPKEDDWEDEWDSTNLDQRGRMPMFVAIKLKALAPDGKETDFVTKTRVFLKKQIQISGVPCLD